jgi:hypothetical protein
LCDCRFGQDTCPSVLGMSEESVYKYNTIQRSVLNIVILLNRKGGLAYSTTAPSPIYSCCRPCRCAIPRLLEALRKVDFGAWRVTLGGLESYQTTLRICGDNVCQRAVRESKRIAEVEKLHVRATELGGQWQVSMFAAHSTRASRMDSTYVVTVVR